MLEAVGYSLFAVGILVLFKRAADTRIKAQRCHYCESSEVEPRDSDKLFCRVCRKYSRLV